MSAADALERGREAFERRAWGEAFARLSDADRTAAPLAPDDLERFAMVAYLVGRDDECADSWSRAHRAHLDRGGTVRAARCAFWLGFKLLKRGEFAQGGGWLARAGQLLDDGPDCVERGYLLVPVGVQRIGAGDVAGAGVAFGEAIAFGVRFHDRDLLTIGQAGRGMALIQLGEVAAGVALFDELMVAVTADEVSPLVAGFAYCLVIEACQAIFDLRRAREWTTALGRWCAAQPDLVPYRGECLVYRAEIMQLHGAWPDAMAEARRACDRLAQPAGQHAAGAAFYRRAELHRLRGEFAEAEAAYRQASRRGRRPDPGLARLRLAQGQVAAAAAMSRRAVGEAHDRATRPGLLAAHVEIMLAAGDAQAARSAAAELAAIAAARDAPFLHAVSAQATGAVLLSAGEAPAALDALRRAWAAWQEIDAPHEAARVRVLIGLACRHLGDEDTAAMEVDAARWVFRQLRAAPDLARVEALARRGAARAASGLTAREVQVLALVAAGKTNRAIAAELSLSEKTVARHVSNIFAKLGLSSRAAATAYAFQHGLV